MTARPNPLIRGTVVIARQKRGLQVLETSRPDCHGVPSKDGRRNALDVLAHLLIERATIAHPLLADARRACRAIVVIEVCEPPLVAAVGRAWVEQVAAAAGSRSCCNPIPVVVRPPASSRTRPADDRDEDMREACRGEPHVLIVAHAGRPWPPADVRASADAVVRLPRIGSDMLVDIATAVGGSRPTVRLRAAQIGEIRPADILAALRSVDEADAFVARVLGIAGARRKAQHAGITLDKLAGMDRAVVWGRSLCRDLADYRQGLLPWRDVDKGVLLAGPPGVGKSSFAQALAASAEVPLVLGSLSAWQAAGHLGDLLKAMRRTFEEAKTMAPSILFIDEVDSFGDRSAFSDHNRDYSVQVVNALLEELDGVGGREGVVVVAAANDASRLDPAVRRSGRLDREIRIDLPDTAALGSILRFHLGEDLSGDDLSVAAGKALGATGADCERWVRGARRRARAERRHMDMADLLAEMPGISAYSEVDRRRAAVHEAGHAIVVERTRPGSLIGVTLTTTRCRPLATSFPTEADLVSTLAGVLAGRAAEELVFGDVSTGSAGGPDADLGLATSMAVRAAADLALGRHHAPLWLGAPDVRFAAMTDPVIQEEAQRLLARSYAEARWIARCDLRAVQLLAEALVKMETVQAEDVRHLLRTR